MPAAKKKKKKNEARGKIVKKDKSTQMRELNEKWLPESGKQTIETKWPDGKDGENDEERLRRKRDGKNIHYCHPIENHTW